MTPPDPSLSSSQLIEIILSLHGTIDALKAALSQAQADAAEARQEIRRLVVMVEGLTGQLDALLAGRNEERREELARLREKAAKIGAAADARQPAPEEPEPGSTTKAPSTKPRGRHEHGRGEIPPKVPRDTERIAGPKTCGKCGGSRLRKRGVEVSEQWNYVRAHLRAARTERDVCECEDCGARGVAPQPPMPFDRAACTFAMMTWLLYSRCALFLPLDRVRRDFEGQGARIASSTLTRWFSRGADLLLPIAASVRLALLTRSHIRTDGTGLTVVFPRVLARPTKGPERAGQAEADGYLPHREPEGGQVLVFGSEHEAVYHYTPTKHGHHFPDFFKLGEDASGKPIVWKGTITADAASVLDVMFNEHDCVESGCNAHGLRKFRDDADKAPLLAARAMAFIGRVFAVEAEARARKLQDAELLAWRQARAGPVVGEFRTWLDTHVTDLLPSNPVRKAMQYYLNHWKALTLFLDDSDVDLDNNWSENALRKIALLRNNSLFAGGHDGAVRLCTVFTLVQTARMVGVDPYAYIEWALRRVVPHPDNRGLRPADLTPAAYAAFLARQP